MINNDGKFFCLNVATFIKERKLEAMRQRVAKANQKYIIVRNTKGRKKIMKHMTIIHKDIIEKEPLI